MKKAILALIILLSASNAFSAKLQVPTRWCPTIQAAIDLAADGDVVEISPGVYEGPGNINLSFRGKAITVRSVDPNAPSVVENTVIDCNWSGRGFYFGNEEDANSVLEGLTITRGFAFDGPAISIEPLTAPLIRNCVIFNNESHGRGAIYCWGVHSAGPTIINCKIRGNFGAMQGGGINLKRGATIIGCDITGNSAGSGGGIYSNVEPLTDRDRVKIVDCNIVDNTAYDGGGIFHSGCSVLDNCRILNNQAYRGGGIYHYGNLLNINRTVIAGNVALSDSSSSGGGGLYSYADGFVISNSIMAGNFSQSKGGGIYTRSLAAKECTFGGNAAGDIGGGIYSEKTSCLYNCILWGNSDSNGTGTKSQLYSPASGATAFLSCIQDDDPNDDEIPFGGEENGNIDDDPLFVRIPDDGGDGWGVGGNDDYGDLHLLPGSPCIDAGSPLFSEPNTTDIDGDSRVVGLATDIGADEYARMIVVTRPVDGEVWATGSTREIKWSQYGVDSVDILLSEDAGESWDAIAAAITGTDSYSWEVPTGLDSNQCVISVAPADGDANVVTYKSGLFTIKPYPQRPAVPPGWQRLGLLPPPDLSRSAGPEVGCLKWVFDTNGPVSSQVAVTRLGNTGYRIYISCEDGLIYSLTQDGELFWSYDTGTSLVGSPALGYYGMVYVGGQNGWIYAFDFIGNLRWTHITDGPVYSTPVVGYDGKIYICSEDGIIYALDDDGSELWTFATRGPAKLSGAILATPAIDKSRTIYVAGLYDPNLYALDTTDGSVKWVCNFEFAPRPSGAKVGSPVASPIIGHDGTIYQALVHDTNLYVIDSNDGAILWRTNLADPCSGLYGDDYITRFGRSSGWCEPAIGHDGTIYVSLDDSYLRAVNPDGSIKWVTRLGMVGGFSLSIDRKGLIYAASDDGYVCVVNPDGTEVSRFKGNGWVTFPIIAQDGTLIVSDSNNRVWAVTGEDCAARSPVLHQPEDILPNWAVDYMDLGVLADCWLQCTDPDDEQACGDIIYIYGSYVAGDINRDLYVNLQDFALLADKWLMAAD